MSLARTSIKFESTATLQPKLELISEYMGDCTKFKSKMRNEINKTLSRLEKEFRAAHTKQDSRAQALYNAYINLSEVTVTVTDGGLFAYMVVRCKSGYPLEISFGYNIADTLYNAVTSMR